VPRSSGITLRQTYAQVGKSAEHHAGCYAHAKQYRRTQREIRKLRTWFGRVIRDAQRKGSEINGAPKHKVEGVAPIRRFLE
jgi:IS5 family transposase